MEDFIHFSTRLSTLIVEEALRMLPYELDAVTTPRGDAYQGKKLDAQVSPFPKLDNLDTNVCLEKLCGISILRSGQCFEKGLRRVIRDAILGSLLIQQNDETGEPLLFHTSLPGCLKKRKIAAETYVMLLDSQISTAAACIMAIRVLLDHGVQEDQCVTLVLWRRESSLKPSLAVS